MISASAVALAIIGDSGAGSKRRSFWHPTSIGGRTRMYDESPRVHAPIVRQARHLDRTMAAGLIDEIRRRLLVEGQSGKAGRTMTLIEVEYAGRTVCLVADREWIEFANEAKHWSPSSIDGLGMPTAALLAILDGPLVDWTRPTWSTVRSTFRPDGLLILAASDNCNV